MESNGLQGPESQAVSWQIASNSLQLANIREGWTSVSANSTDFVELLAPTFSDATVIPQILSVLLISQERFLMRLTGFFIAATHGVFRLLSSSRDLNGSEIFDQRQLPSIWKGGIVVFPDQYLRQISGWAGDGKLFRFPHKMSGCCTVRSHVPHRVMTFLENALGVSCPSIRRIAS